MGITEILRRICLFSANNIKSSEQPIQLIVLLNSTFWHIIVTLNFSVNNHTQSVGAQLNANISNSVNLAK
jgi:hypothetical protein